MKSSKVSWEIKLDGKTISDSISISDLEPFDEELRLNIIIKRLTFNIDHKLRKTLTPELFEKAFKKRFNI